MRSAVLIVGCWHAVFGWVYAIAPGSDVNALFRSLPPAPQDDAVPYGDSIAVQCWGGRECCALEANLSCMVADPALPRRPRSAELEHLSEVFLRGAMPPAWTFAKPGADLGIDYIVEVVESGATTGLRFNVQLKATDKIQSAGAHAIQRCRTATLNYHLQCHDPTMLVLVEAQRNDGYYIWVNDYLAQLSEHEPGWHWKKTQTIRLPKTNRLNRASAISLVDYLRSYWRTRRGHRDAQSELTRRRVNLPTVFVSYSSKDLPFVKRLAGDLRDKGVNVWLDQWEIRVGDSILQKIEEGIRAHDHFAVVLSPEAVASTWVRRELEAVVMQQHAGRRVAVLPILYRPCELPPFLAGIRYADFTASYDSGLQQLVAVLAPEISRYGPTAALVPVPRPRGSFGGGPFMGFRSPATGEDYYLHSKEVTLHGGRRQTVYFFARAIDEGVCGSLPDGYETTINSRTGLPMLKKRDTAVWSV